MTSVIALIVVVAPLGLLAWEFYRWRGQLLEWNRDLRQRNHRMFEMYMAAKLSAIESADAAWAERWAHLCSVLAACAVYRHCFKCDGEPLS
jgi:hypothetical protein